MADYNRTPKGIGLIVNDSADPGIVALVVTMYQGHKDATMTTKLRLTQAEALDLAIRLIRESR